MTMTIRIAEDFVKRIEAILEKEDKHIDWLMEVKIDLLNNKYTEVDQSIDRMITESCKYVDFYKLRLEEYKQLVDKMYKARA